MADALDLDSGYDGLDALICVAPDADEALPSPLVETCPELVDTLEQIFAESPAPADDDIDALVESDAIEKGDPDDEEYFAERELEIAARHSSDFEHIKDSRGRLGRVIFERRKANASAPRPTSPAEPGSLEHAEEYFAVAKKRRDDALAQLEADGEPATTLISETTSRFLTVPVAIMHCWPPKKVDPELGLQDESIPSARLWRKLGLFKGATMGPDVHTDNVHSSDSRDATFPVTRRDGTVNWDVHGCSNARAAVMKEFARALIHYRLLYTPGETVFDGFGLAGQLYRELAAPAGVVLEELQRVYSIDDKNADDFVPLKVGVRLAWSSTVSSSSSSSSALSAPVTPLLDRAMGFSHYLALAPHVSTCLYAKRSPTFPLLRHVQVTQTTFEEAMLFAGVRTERRNGRILLRIYKSRMYKAKGIFVPPAVWSAGQIMRNSISAEAWDEQRARAELGDRFIDKLARWEEIATETGRVEEFGFLHKAIWGWWEWYRRGGISLRFPFPSIAADSSPTSAPAAGSDGRVLGCGSMEMARNIIQPLRLPYPAGDSDPAFVTAPTAETDGRIIGVSNLSRQRSEGVALRFPVPAEGDDRNAITAPTAATDGRLIGASPQEMGRSTKGVVRYPLEAIAGAEAASLDSLAFAADTSGRALGLSWAQSTVTTRIGRYPHDADQNDKSTSPAPLAMTDGRLLGEDHHLAVGSSRRPRFPAPTGRSKSAATEMACVAGSDGRIVGDNDTAHARVGRRGNAQPLSRALGHRYEAAVNVKTGGNNFIYLPDADRKSAAFAHPALNDKDKVMIGVDVATTGQDGWIMTLYRTTATQKIAATKVPKRRKNATSKATGKLKASGKKNWGSGDVERGMRLLAVTQKAAEDTAEDGDVLYEIEEFDSDGDSTKTEKFRHPIPKKGKGRFLNAGKFVAACSMGGNDNPESEEDDSNKSGGGTGDDGDEGDEA